MKRSLVALMSTSDDRWSWKPGLAPDSSSAERISGQPFPKIPANLLPTQYTRTSPGVAVSLRIHTDFYRSIRMKELIGSVAAGQVFHVEAPLHQDPRRQISPLANLAIRDDWPSCFVASR